MCYMILRSMKPLLVIENCFGLVRYRTGTDNSVETRLQKIATSIAFLWIINVIIFSLIPAIKVGIKRPEVLLEGLPWQIITLQYAATLLIVLTQKNKYQQIITLLSEADLRLQSSYVKNIHHMSYKKALFCITIFISFCIFILTMDILTVDGYRYEYVIYLLIYCERKIEITTFLFSLSMLRQRLLAIEKELTEILNRQLRNKHRKLKITNFHRGNRNCDGVIKNNISSLASSYGYIGEACHILNTAYNFAIHTAPVAAFIFIMSTFWASFSCFKRNANIKALIKIVTWSFSELITIIIMSIYCEKVLKARDKIKSIVYNILKIDNLTKDMQHQAKAFMELIELWPMSIYAYDMYQINLKLVLNFVGICTSYLIIIIQINDFI
nr:gustatory receptor 51 [Papilio dardanus]